MTRILRKAAKAHFEAVLTENFAAVVRKISRDHAFKVAESSLNDALSDRNVKSNLNEILHKTLVSVWRGAAENRRIEHFIRRLNYLVNLHFPESEGIELSKTSITTESKIEEIRDLVIDKIMEKFAEVGL